MTEVEIPPSDMTTQSGTFSFEFCVRLEFNTFRLSVVNVFDSTKSIFNIWMASRQVASCSSSNQYGLKLGMFQLNFSKNLQHGFAHFYYFFYAYCNLCRFGRISVFFCCNHPIDGRNWCMVRIDQNVAITTVKLIIILFLLSLPSH